ncbi:uncharacterized protein K489DRAFT_305603, partial [Dissoconium aciculare CBS 342.82]|uniref:Heterokaryon incompatibility domain-containing protein n=1 Tax=Dissoconium aciculare CBS 342.82 TaxID=1314786 RepID=A0A6J3M4T9_9PEZI
FTPLSYTWGEPAQTKRIYINGAHLPVTAQLHRAMTCLRKLQSNLIKKDFFSESSNSSETFWWIDAICVNQQDLDERSHQVSLMTRLYRSAELVHVWLGDEDDTTTKAMRLVHHVAYRPTSYEDILSWKYIRKPGQTHRPAGPEIALPSAVMINCGSQQCTWEELMRTASTLSFFSDDLAIESAQAGKALAHSPTVSCFQNAMALDEVRAATARGQKYIAFTDLACHTRDCLATDARDKVYAMLPMTNPDEIPTKADYRIDKFEAYVAVLLPLFSSDLNFLAACQNEEMPLDRPSWIPDFNQPWIAHPIWPFLSPQCSLRKHDFRAGVPIIEHFATSRSLAVHGVVLDEIDRIDTAYVQHNNADHSTLRNLIDTWWTFSHDRRRELLDETDLTGVDWRSILFINSCYDEDVFKKSLCLNPQWDTSARGPEARESRYTPMKDRALKDDPTFQRVRDTLLGIEDDSGVTELMVNEDVSLSEPKGLGHFRRMAIGRRAAMTTQGLTCLIPEYAQLGDSVAWFKGSTETYVLRPQGESGWSIVGSTCKF